MTADFIFSTLKDYFLLALLALIALSILFFILYYVVYRKLLGRDKRLSKKQMLVSSMFVGYVIMVIGVTIIDRGAHFNSQTDFSLFNSYREAWNNFGIPDWQFIILNIVMFVPFGILFPLLHSRFQKAVWTIGSGLLFTLSIELFQLITGLGIFEVDDLFNNLLGAILGYGIVMGILKIRKKKFKRAVAYFSPLFLVLILFGGMFAYYHLKEFGNLSLAASTKVDMNETTVILDVVLDDMDSTVPIYKVNSYSHTEAKEFVEAFFKNIDIGTEELEEDLYLDTGFYTTRVDPTFRVSFEFFDGRYDYLDFSSLDGIDLKDTDEKNLLNKLTNFGINIPTHSQFQQTETGSYEWTIRNDLENDQLLEGYISVNYYADDSIKNISNQAHYLRQSKRRSNKK
ncbi:VanZ family protein [Alkalicoccobacillus plakortidis]|uniref:VanZ family protein n=1 Tax=Alkalicoccobacillus plakortidis TaxID=444060 RepID=A0ABT0XLU9_9BACI|nr:VanZ family protein [Alkalicoccobacillus plakortidis]MCM2676891.1 VanZ family protein [Alkalicoccobacillus plakortidis]